MRNSQCTVSMQWCFTYNFKLLVSVVCVIMVCAGFFAASPLVLLGEKNMLINRYYSAKTLHMHKVTPSAAVPSQWNSLGSMYPYYETSVSEHARATMVTNTMPAVDGAVLPTMYFIYEGYVPQKEQVKQQHCYQRTYKEDNEEPQYDTRNPEETRCVLEDPYRYTLFINGETLSILSSISPAIYLATLIVVCQLSLVYFVFAVLFNHHAHVAVSHQTKSAIADKPTILESIRHCISRQSHDDKGTAHAGVEMARDWCCFAVLLVYSAYLFVYFVTSPTMLRANWGPGAESSQTVEYGISSQIPSVLYSGFVLAIYYAHLRRKDPYWEYLFAKPKPTADSTTHDMPMVASSIVAPATAKSMYAMMHSTWPQQQQHLIMDSSALVSHARITNEISGDKDRGPVANETSIIVCVIVVLGGIANLGMTQGFLLETEAQLVVVSLFAFYILEFGRTHLVAYFWYLSEHHVLLSADDSKRHKEAISHNKMMRFMLAFVNVIVFVLQLLVVIIWQMTMDSLLTYPMDALRVLLLFVVVMFLILRLISVLDGVVEVYFDLFDHSWLRNLLWRCEGAVYILSVWVFILALLLIPVTPNAGYEDSNGTRRLSTESTLRFIEKMLYTAMKDTKILSKVTAEHGNTCKNGTHVNKLMFTTVAHTHTDSKTSFDCTEEKVYYADTSDEHIDPVDMKVFAWTRFFQLRNRLTSSSVKDECFSTNCQGSAVLFCSNAFEQHWGQCKQAFQHSPGDVLRKSWKDTVLDSTKMKTLADGTMEYAGVGHVPHAPNALTQTHTHTHTHTP